MNFIRFQAGLKKGDNIVSLDNANVAIPAVREDLAHGNLVLGVRPEHIRIDEKSKLRGAVYESEYLGTTQIVAIEMEGGIIKARMPANRKFAVGEPVGLALDTPKLSLFSEQTGLAILTDVSMGARHG